jgi:hypothetical protein
MSSGFGRREVVSVLTENSFKEVRKTDCSVLMKSEQEASVDKLSGSSAVSNSERTSCVCGWCVRERNEGGKRREAETSVS